MKDKIGILSISNARNAKLLVAGYPGGVLKSIKLFFKEKCSRYLKYVGEKCGYVQTGAQTMKACVKTLDMII
jgi:hypothetical protein